ncbi:hypothetical protein F503_08694 [Ophiostoma piceae UAMH 11346]|uniref:Uncharacterized protein n=1 Tax=Ophiostoma piceae (strain UAMH 11346) TaxID=1262450 RepID=S3CR11_OPHP1|nr:hypothetical protein F503_08694 [Ophiostoma piceae UAMH 11346]
MSSSSEYMDIEGRPTKGEERSEAEWRFKVLDARRRGDGDQDKLGDRRDLEDLKLIDLRDLRDQEEEKGRETTSEGLERREAEVERLEAGGVDRRGRARRHSDHTGGKMPGYSRTQDTGQAEDRNTEGRCTGRSVCIVEARLKVGIEEKRRRGGEEEERREREEEEEEEKAMRRYERMEDKSTNKEGTQYGWRREGAMEQNDDKKGKRQNDEKRRGRSGR